MSDTQNQWIPVSERLPEVGCRKLVITKDRRTFIATVDKNGIWCALGRLEGVTHWMDLPKPPEPPKPADPFEDWWHSYPTCETQSEAARAAWNAAKEHYAKPKDYDEHLKPLPDFETWAKGRCADGPFLRVLDRHTIVHDNVCRAIWNAAQGKPEA